ncbi:hypothetical protein BC827DRAFT_219953 [Russula dissimulans]|nr:hypothetical protein BC827DRAFT_219953 [Russula dissimulans]
MGWITVAVQKGDLEQSRFSLPGAKHHTNPAPTATKRAKAHTLRTTTPSSLLYPNHPPLVPEMSSDMDTTLASFAPTSAFAISSSSMMSSPSSVLSTPNPTRASKSITSFASTPTPTPTPTCRRLPVQHDLTTPRARARVARQRANEAAEHREDLAALITTPAQWALLRRSFASVKTEFTDLDGMSWNIVPAVHVATRPTLIGPGRPSSPLVYGSASAPVLALDDHSTVRPTQGGKQRLSVSVPGWRRHAVTVAGMGHR